MDDRVETVNQKFLGGNTVLKELCSREQIKREDTSRDRGDNTDIFGGFRRIDTFQLEKPLVSGRLLFHIDVVRANSPQRPFVAIKNH